MTPSSSYSIQEGLLLFNFISYAVLGTIIPSSNEWIFKSVQEMIAFRLSKTLMKLFQPKGSLVSPT